VIKKKNAQGTARRINAVRVAASVRANRKVLLGPSLLGEHEPGLSKLQVLGNEPIGVAEDFNVCGAFALPAGQQPFG
jgi:hypothetical protein